jgi:hypothetical protein
MANSTTSEKNRAFEYLTGWKGIYADPRSPAGGVGPGHCRLPTPFGAGPSLALSKLGLHPNAFATKSNTGFPVATAPVVHRVQVSHLSDENLQRLYYFLKVSADKLQAAPNWKIVYVNAKTGDYFRRAPGAAKLQQLLDKKLGADFVPLLHTLISVATQAIDDSRRQDLTGAQNLGRASLAILLSLSGIATAVDIAGIVDPSIPKKFDDLTAAAFTDKNPIIDMLSNVIVSLGGKRFQEWSSTPSLIDYY